MALFQRLAKSGRTEREGTDVSSMMKGLCILAFILVFAAMAGNPSFPTDAAAQTSEGEALVKNVCSRCHSAQRICANLGRDQIFWERTVTRMRQNGAPLSPPDISSTATYLAGQTKDTAPFCN